jgi:hypothetical protein
VFRLSAFHEANVKSLDLTLSSFRRVCALTDELERAKIKDRDTSSQSVEVSNFNTRIVTETEMDDQTRDWLLDHHREAYKFQADRSEKIRDRLSFLVTPFTILGGAILYVLSNYRHAFSTSSVLIFYVPVVVSLLIFLAALGTALYCLGWGFQYDSVPRPRGLQEDVEKIANYAAAHAPALNVLGDVKTTMMERYSSAADYNFSVNFRRTNLVLRAMQLGIVSFIVLLFSLPAFFSNKLQAKPRNPTVIFYKEVKPHHERRTERTRSPAGGRARNGQAGTHTRRGCPGCSTREADNQTKYETDGVD